MYAPVKTSDAEENKISSPEKINDLKENPKYRIICGGHVASVTKFICWFNIVGLCFSSIGSFPIGLIFTIPLMFAYHAPISGIKERNPGKFIPVLILSIYPPGGHASLQHIPFPFESKKINVTFTLDISSFYGLHVNVIDDKNDLNEKLPKLKIGDKPEKLRIIFEKQNFSVTLFANGNKEYPMKDSDEKTPICIAFTQKKPLIGKAAKEVYDEKPEFVVYDLIKLCSISTSDVMNPKWKFELSKNPESGAIAVTFQSEKGKTEASADFLLALILRNAIKRVLKETGELVFELEIGFNGFSPNEMLKKNFIEAAASIKFRGKLMKVKTAFI